MPLHKHIKSFLNLRKFTYSFIKIKILGEKLYFLHINFGKVYFLFAFFVGKVYFCSIKIVRKV